MEDKQVYIVVAVWEPRGVYEYVHDVFSDRTAAEDECKRLDKKQYDEFLEGEGVQWEKVPTFEEFKIIRDHMLYEILERPVIRR